MVKNPSANVGDIRDMNLIPGLGRSPGTGNGNPLQYSCLENPMDRGSWGVVGEVGGVGTVHRVTKTSTRLSMHAFTICIYHAFTIGIYHLERSMEEMSLPQSTPARNLWEPLTLWFSNLPDYSKLEGSPGDAWGWVFLTSTPDDSNRPDLGTTGL